MAEVSFTLNDIRGLIEESELRVTTAVKESFAEYEAKYDARFDGIDQRLDKVEHRLGKVELGLKDVQGEVKGLGRVVSQHSVEIMELKARAT